MKDGPNIAKIAALLGDERARRRADRAHGRSGTDRERTGQHRWRDQTNDECPFVKAAGCSRSSPWISRGATAISGWPTRMSRGLLESLMGVAFRTGAVRLLSSPREPALRKARVCYDHLAGELGVLAYESLLRNDLLEMSAQGTASQCGRNCVVSGGRYRSRCPARRRRIYCRACMDWSERRYHLAGSLGAALLSRVCAQGWARRDRASRVVHFAPKGERRFRELLKLA